VITLDNLHLSREDKREQKMRLRDVAEHLGTSTATVFRTIKQMEIYGYYSPRRTPGGHYRFTIDDVRLIDRYMNQEGIRRNPAKRLFQRRMQREW